MSQLRTQIYSLAYGGDGVGKVDGKVCFVKGALPGEDVVFNPVKETASYIKGDLARVDEPSPDRVEPKCPHYGVCGGCQLQHVSYEKELFYKKAQAEELVRRLAGIKQFICGEIVASPAPYNYRGNVTMHKGDTGYGYYARDGRTVIKIANCAIADEHINDELSLLDAGGRNDRMTLKVDHNGHVWSSIRPGERFFVDRYRDVNMTFSPHVFSQCNRYISGEIAETLDNWIGEVRDDAVLFDVYCGIGFFSFLIKQKFSARIGIDSERVSIDCAKTTVRDLGFPGAKFYRGIVEEKFPGLFEKNMAGENVVLIDPPRKGVKKEFIEWIAASSGVGRMFYMSCDPATLARDIKVVVSGGAWKLGRSVIFDMFPRTGHIEMLIEFVR
ncbi:MAG: hypothetical protein KJ995_00780 [Candidatus Omnitrophica bacterium]|nr:hypothetical protein [Candidatus Omnitrophota bacterium]MBU1128241.1 hypothetical protein [Candidatus Omnitrophota bacterium]MBU1784408.1 hypothetical protein [Candidatus Omnitrophota bacterium]MBU1850927.1 hypothetical protein [Candidatus Omnitrophota bacterium]